jgi:hypothetical protein
MAKCRLQMWTEPKGGLHDGELPLAETELYLIISQWRSCVREKSMCAREWTTLCTELSLLAGHSSSCIWKAPRLFWWWRSLRYFFHPPLSSFGLCPVIVCVIFTTGLVFPEVSGTRDSPRGCWSVGQRKFAHTRCCLHLNHTKQECTSSQQVCILFSYRLCILVLCILNLGLTSFHRSVSYIGDLQHSMNALTSVVIGRVRHPMTWFDLFRMDHW